jgi:deoxycytidylate deaminase
MGGVKKNSNRTCFVGKTVFSVHAEQAVVSFALRRHGLSHLLPLLHCDVRVKSFQRKGLAKARRMFRGMVLCVYRETSNGEMANAMPCLHCKKMLLRFGIRTVEYSTPDGWVRRKVREIESTQTLAHRMCSNVLRNQ